MTSFIKISPFIQEILRCIKFKGALLWNDLPDYIKNIRSINKFKPKLKSYLQQNYILE